MVDRLRMEQGALQEAQQHPRLSELVVDECSRRTMRKARVSADLVPREKHIEQEALVQVGPDKVPHPMLCQVDMSDYSTVRESRWRFHDGRRRSTQVPSELNRERRTQHHEPVFVQGRQWQHEGCAPTHLIECSRLGQ